MRHRIALFLRKAWKKEAGVSDFSALSFFSLSSLLLKNRINGVNYFAESRVGRRYGRITSPWRKYDKTVAIVWNRWCCPDERTRDPSLRSFRLCREEIVYFPRSKTIINLHCFPDFSSGMFIIPGQRLSLLAPRVLPCYTKSFDIFPVVHSGTLP